MDKATLEKALRNAFICGVAFTCAEIVRRQGDPQTVIKFIAKSNLSLHDFEKADPEPDDLTEIRKIYEQLIPHLQKQNEKAVP